MATAVKERPILFWYPMVNAMRVGKKTQTRRIIKQADIFTESVNQCADDSWISWTGKEPREGWQRTTEIAYPSGGGFRCPYGMPSDHIWVRETWCLLDRCDWHDPNKPRDFRPFPNRLNAVVFRADCGSDSERCREELGYKWRSPIHMPRWASRITLEITRVRAEQLQDITEDDAIAEGLEERIGDGTGPGSGFKWNGRGYWDFFSTGHYGKTYHAPGIGGLCCCIVGQKENLTPARCAFRHLWDKINGEGSWSENPWLWTIDFKVCK